MQQEARSMRRKLISQNLKVSDWACRMMFLLFVPSGSLSLLSIIQLGNLGSRGEPVLPEKSGNGEGGKREA
jgi:hypothetical protein